MYNIVVCVGIFFRSLFLLITKYLQIQGYISCKYLKNLLKSKKFKNILITIVEILVVAGIIFAALMYMQSKINKDADKTSGVGNTIATDEEEKTVQKQSE